MCYRIWLVLRSISGLVLLTLLFTACGGSAGIPGSETASDYADSNEAAVNETPETTYASSATEDTLLIETTAGEASADRTDGSAPSGRSQKLLDELPEATTPQASAEPATIDEQGGLEDYLEYMAYQEINPFWAQQFASLEETSRAEEQYASDQYASEEGDPYYTSANLEVDDQLMQTGCGGEAAGVETGSLYCPLDNTVYFVIGSELEDARKYGPFSFAFTLAHEWGHHVQNQLGFFPYRDENSDVAFENQADCFAGVWASSYYARGYLDNGDISSGIEASYDFGDLRSEEEGKAHGSPEERVRWFLTGFDTGDPTECKAFAG